MTDLTVTSPAPTGLSIDPQQDRFTEQQVAVLRHLGVESASEGDLAVFFHQAKRTGLDPFIRQIYMIGRNTKDQRTNQWVTKYTIQTGIDGYRVIGHRAANQQRATISIKAPQWATPEGQWRDLWLPKWGHPLAARVTILKNGSEFTAVALFDEYKQTKRDGGLTQMWEQRPAGQIAKCAEALAWRLAFPQDTAGVYLEDEMHQADNPQPDAPAEPSERSGVSRLRAALPAKPHTEPEPATEPAQGNVEPQEPPVDEALQGGDEGQVDGPITDKQRRHLHALVNQLGIDRDTKLAALSRIASRPITSSNELTETEAAWAISGLQVKVDQMGAGE